MTPLTASSVFSVRVCQVFWMSLQIFSTSGAEDVLFLSYSDLMHFFSPASSHAELWYRRSMFPLSIKQSLGESTKHLSLRMSAGQRLLENLKVIISDSLENVTGVIYSPQTYCRWLYGGIAPTWGALKILQPSTGVNELLANTMHDPNSSDAYDRCLSLQVGVNVKRFTFSFNQSLARVGTLTWQSLWSVIWVNGCVIYQNSWQAFRVQKCFENQQRERRLPTA